MKKITLKIKPNSVLQRIKTHTYYTGEARKEAGVPLRLAAGLQASDDDDTQLLDHLSTATGEIAKIISRYLAVCDTKESGTPEYPDIFAIIYTLPLPANYPAECLSQIERAIENYSVTRTLQLWLMQQKPDETPLIANELQTHIQQLCELCTMRSRPTLKTTRNNIINF